MRFQFNPFTDKLDISGTGPGVTSVDFLTGNSGGQVAADASFNINVIGDNTTGIDTIGNLSPNTLTIFGLPSTTTQVGTTRYATNAEAAAQSSGAVALTPSNITSFFSTSYLPSSQGGTGLSSPAAHQLIVTNGSSAYTPLGVASNGQIPIGSIASNPVLANITSSGGTITITNGPGSINIDLSGGGVGIDSLSPDSGTDPVVPTAAGLVNDKGSGSITTVGSLNTITTQLTGLTNHAVLVGAGTATITKLGVGSNGQVLLGSTAADPVFATLTSSDSSISFTTGAGSLSLQVASGTGVVKTITGDTGGALSPTAGNINTLGTGSITIAGSGSTLTTQLTGLTNHALLVGAGTATITKLGVGTSGQVLIAATAADPAFATLTSSDSSISFTTGANSLSLQVASGTAVVKTLTGNTGGALSPTAGNISTVGTGSITIAGSGSTLTSQLTGLTNHNVLIGAGSATITNVAPSATSGVPLISQGSSADPVFGTAVVAGGGTGATSFTAYAPICGGTTTTGALQSAATGIATSGFVLTSNGNAALPSFQAAASGGFTSVVVQVFTSSGTYTPTASMKYCTIEVVGGGGGGGGSAAGGASSGAVGGGGGGGGYGRKTVAAATIGASKAVTIASASAGGNGAANGTAGGTCSLDTIVTATGGAGGIASAAAATVSAAGGAGGVGTSGDINSNGGPGGNGTYVLIAGVAQMTNGGFGGSSYFGGGAVAVISQAGGANLTGNNGTAYGGGGGGGGASSSSGAGGGVGGNGAQGVVIVTEYI